MTGKSWHVPVRLATGAYILNSGLSKREADRETAEGLHGFAASAYPQVREIEPERFVHLLSTAEILLGIALLLPKLPSWVAGAGLTTFAGALNGLYWAGAGSPPGV